MDSHRQFQTGIGGICLGNGLVAVSFVLDRSAGLSVTVAVVGPAALGLAGATAILWSSYNTPERFAFDRRYAATGALICGLVAVFAGFAALVRVML